MLGYLTTAGSAIFTYLLGLPRSLVKLIKVNLAEDVKKPAKSEEKAKGRIRVIATVQNTHITEESKRGPLERECRICFVPECLTMKVRHNLMLNSHL